MTTVDDFYRPRYLYQLTPEGEAAELALAAYHQGRCCVPSARGMLKPRSSPDQIAKASSSNATATRRLAGSSTASS